MPHLTTARPLREALQPLIAGVLLAATHPALTADAIEVLGVGSSIDPLCLRVFLYHPGDRVFEQWARAINAADFGTPRPTSRPGELTHTMVGRIGATPIEVNCVSLRGEWVWRTAGGGVHKRDSSKDGAVAACGDLITGVAAVADWQTPRLRCPGCANTGTVPAVVR